MVETVAVQKMSPNELKQRHVAGEPIELIDVRTPAEFREVHVAFARNIPLDQLDPEHLRNSLEHSPDKSVYVICRSGSRADKAAQALLRAGFRSVHNIEGGTMACEAVGLPLVRGKKAISLERQVRIGAGAMVLAGSLLGFFVHPYWVALAAFVGAGLVFAGITDTCGMAMVLARMPWNQVKPEGESVGQCATGAATSPKDSGGCCST